MTSIASNLEQLRLWRDHNDRKSGEIIEIWEETLMQSINNFGKEKPLVLEQVCIAALDCFRLEIVQKCVTELYKDFPKSLRVKKYEAMYFEAQEKYDEAIEILDGIIKADETNSGAKKRKIAILKAQGKTIEAIRELTEYLKVFMADVEAWQELSELYINENDFNKAAFCVEELILHNPHNHLLHQRYADIKYSQGGLDNIEIARAYYCQAVKLNPKNLRAFYGIYLATSAIANSQKCPAQKKKETLKLCDWSLSEIKKLYQENKVNSSQNDNLQNCLNALQIN